MKVTLINPGATEAHLPVFVTSYPATKVWPNAEVARQERLFSSRAKITPGRRKPVSKGWKGHASRSDTHA